MFKVLLVEDDPILLRMYHNKFISKGIEVVEVADGKKALETAAAEQPDFILLDLIMPGMSGFAVLDELKKHDQTKDLPVGILSVVNEDYALTQSPNLKDKLVAYWRKDQQEPSQIVNLVEDYLQKHP